MNKPYALIRYLPFTVRWEFGVQSSDSGRSEF